MSDRLAQEPAMRVAGICVRTSNRAPERIGELWRQFHDDGVAAKLERRVDENVYSVYSGYESDASGEFDVLIGCAVSAASILPEGFADVMVAAGDYAVFAVSGPMPKAIADTWATIWATTLRRAYKTDFERYQPDGTITVHVGVL